MASNGATHRMRIKIACEECRKNKRKCDGLRPACSLCNKSGRECLYASELSRKRRNYDEELVRNLENQIRILETALRSRSRGNGPELETHNGTVSMADCEFHESAHSIPPPPVTVSGPAHSSWEHRPSEVRSSSAMEELASLMLEMDIEEKGEPSFTIAAGQRKPTPRDAQSSLAGSDPRREQGDSSPEQAHDTLCHLVECFTKHFNTFHQFLDQDDAVEVQRRGINVEILDLRFRNSALLAVAACFSPLPEAEEMRAAYASLADGLALRCIKERPNDLVVQGLTLLAWKELMFGAPSLAYNYIAMATGQILHLGLHVSALTKAFSQPDTDPDRRPHLRRIRSFWAYFSVDRLLTSSLGMNCTLHWQRVRLHSFRSVIDGDPSLDEVAHDTFCQLWHLWDSSMDQVYAFGWAQLSSSERESLVFRSHQSLTEFYATIDDRLRLRKDYLPDPAVWVQMAYHTALLLVHRPLLNEARGSSALEFALRSTTNAATSIARIVRSYRKSKKLESIAPQIIDYILSAAVIHLLNATSGKTVLGRQSAIGLRSCVEAMEEIKSQWPLIATRSIRQVQELAHRWHVVWALPVHLLQSENMPTSLRSEIEDAMIPSASLPAAATHQTLLPHHHGMPLGVNVADLASLQHGTRHDRPEEILYEHCWNLNDLGWDDPVGEGGS